MTEQPNNNHLIITPISPSSTLSPSQNKSTLFTTTSETKSNNNNNANDPLSLPKLHHNILYREVLAVNNINPPQQPSSQRNNHIIGNISTFKKHIPTYEHKDDDISQYFNNKESIKDKDVIVNVSHLDIENSFIQNIEIMDTIFKETEEYIASGKRLSSEMKSFEMERNKRKTENVELIKNEKGKNEDERKVKKNEEGIRNRKESNNAVNRKFVVVFGILVVILCCVVIGGYLYF